MSLRTIILRSAGNAAGRVRSSFIPAFIAAAVVLTGGYFFLRQNDLNFQKELKVNVENELNIRASRLESEFNKNILALRSVVNVFSIDPSAAAERFDQLANKILLQNLQMTRLSAAPASVIRMTYPKETGERIIGTNLKRYPVMRSETARSQSRGTPIVAGPLRLPSGRTGFGIYLPVFTSPKGRPLFWGFMKADVDERALYANAQLMEFHKNELSVADGHRHIDINIAIRNIVDKHHIPEPFLGDALLFKSAPVVRQLALPGVIWEIAAVPSAGWQQEPSNSGLIRFSILAAAVIIIIPILVAGGLMNERQRNMAALRLRERELSTVSHRLELALDSSKIGIWEIDLDTQERSWDQRMYHLHGLRPGESAPTFDHWRDTVHPDDIAEASMTLLKALDENLDYRSQYRILLEDEQIRHIRNIGSTHVDADGRTKITGISWDITDDVTMTERLRAANSMAEAKNMELAQAKDRIEHNALHDPLTGLGNRRMLDNALERLASARKEEMPDIALLHIDLDRFKQINDTLGHAAGDAMLVHASKILRSTVRDEDMVARIGGDEFVVMVFNAGGKAFLETLSQRIITQMRQPVDYNGFPCRFGVSIGIATGNATDIKERKLLVNADIALYRAKENGRNRYEFFTDLLQAEVTTTKRIADEILEGIENDEFVPWYQPQFDASSLKLVGVEALVRWNHPREGILTPDKFLKIAEELNVVAVLDRIVLDRSLIDGMRWAALGIDVPKISVNVSAKRLRDDGLLRSLQGLSLSPGQLSFELVESIFLDESDDIVTANIEGIKSLGIDIEIDDFGTGHTSIVSLLKIKPKRLKIDRQLVAPILRSRNEQALIRSIIEIGRSLNIETVAEGVETMGHAEMLGLLGCNMLQGYAFAKPLSFDDFVHFANNRILTLAS